MNLSRLNDAGAVAAPPPRLSWGLCVATLDRIDLLEASLRLALGQTRPPVEVVVCDASADWEANRRRIAAAAAGHPGVRLDYVPSERRSLTAQRNAAVARARADVLFMIDDDSLMHPDCAEAIMRVYEADPGRRVAAVAATRVLRRPAARGASALPGALADGSPPEGSRLARLMALTQRSRLAGFLAREVLMMARERRFVGYDRATRHTDAADFAALGIPGTAHAPFVSGYALTVRRDVVLLEPFDDGLIAYCAAEDLDASYRFSRHGLNVRALDARVFHAEAPANRLGRRTVATLTLANVAYLVRKNSDSPGRHAALFAVHLARTALAGLLSDGLSGRWSFPRLRGALRAVPTCVAVLRQPRRSVQRWYADAQQRILSEAPRPAAPRSAPPPTGSPRPASPRRDAP